MGMVETTMRGGYGSGMFKVHIWPSSSVIKTPSCANRLFENRWLWLMVCECTIFH
jgi:hypothetical protein